MPRIAGIGEALFDVYPDGTRRLGGATLNFAVHAHQLQRRIGGHGIPVTRAGRDDLGRELVDCLKSFDTDTSFTQMDPERKTGQVMVTFDGDGSPNYDILRDVAWDAIEFDDRLRGLAGECDGVCFGTLGQRDPVSRQTIQSFVEAVPRSALRLCDINLRQQYFSEELINRSLELSNAAKLNDAELEVVSRLLDISGSPLSCIGKLMERFQLDYLILTRGEKGTAIHTTAGGFEGKPVSNPPSTGADPVGAGDSCAAAVAVGLLLGHGPAQVATFANQVGAYVASQPGGTPCLPDELLVNPDCTLPV